MSTNNQLHGDQLALTLRVTKCKLVLYRGVDEGKNHAMLFSSRISVRFVIFMIVGFAPVFVSYNASADSYKNPVSSAGTNNFRYPVFHLASCTGSTTDFINGVITGNDSAGQDCNGNQDEPATVDDQPLTPATPSSQLPAPTSTPPARVVTPTDQDSTGSTPRVDHSGPPRDGFDAVMRNLDDYLED